MPWRIVGFVSGTNRLAIEYAKNARQPARA
jgi:hypothetical protein